MTLSIAMRKNDYDKKALSIYLITIFDTLEWRTVGRADLPHYNAFCHYAIKPFLRNIMTNTFTMNGKSYLTDIETLEIIRQYAYSAKRGDSVAINVIAMVMALGLKTGRIIEKPSNR